WSGALVGFMALLVFILAGSGAPELRQSMMASIWAWPLQIATATAAITAFVALWRRRFRVARFAAIIQTTLILWGWALAQFPNLILPALSIQPAAAPPATLRLVMIALVIGAVILLPSFVYLLRTFKTDTTPA